ALRVGVRQARAALHIRLERTVFLQYGQELAADVLCRRLERFEPGKRGALVELDLRQSGKVVLARLLRVDALPAGEDVERLGEARAVARRRQPLAQERLE